MKPHADALCVTINSPTPEPAADGERHVRNRFSIFNAVDVVLLAFDIAAALPD